MKGQDKIDERRRFISDSENDVEIQENVVDEVQESEEEENGDNQVVENIVEFENEEKEP